MVCQAETERTSGLARRLLFAALAAYVVAFTGLSLYRYEHYWTLSYDLALYAQALHHPGHVSVNSAPLLGIHAHYVHLLLVPCAWLGVAIPAMFLLQSLSVAAAGGALYRYGRARELAPWHCLAAAAAFLLTPLIQFPNLAEFHPELFGVAFAAWAVVFLVEERFGPYLLALLLLCAVKETAGILAVGLGLVELVGGRLAGSGRPARYGAAALGVGGAGFLIGVFLVGALNTNGIVATSFYQPLGDSIPEVLGTLLRHPVDSARVLLTAERALLLLTLLGGFAFLSLPRPRWALAALPFLGAHLLATVPTIHTVRYHYHALTVTFLALAAVDGIAAVPARRRGLACGLLLAFAGGMHLLASPVTELPLWTHRAQELQRKQVWDAVVEAIPPGHGVAAPIECAAHFSDRAELHLTPFALYGYEHSQRQLPFPEGIDYLIATSPVYEGPRSARGEGQVRQPLVDWLRGRGDWQPWLEGPSVWVYRRASAPGPEAPAPLRGVGGPSAPR